jgi:hypothetical protein
MRASPRLLAVRGSIRSAADKQITVTNYFSTGPQARDVLMVASRMTTSSPRRLPR